MEVDSVVCMDALELLRGLPDSSISLIATDPPYMGVKDEAWDNQWDSVAQYIEWLRSHLAEFRRVLKPNGSLYLFASPQMAARVEIAVSDYFNVLNNIRWAKPMFSTKAEMFDKDTMRGYFPSSETIIFAEQCGSDGAYESAVIDGGQNYFGALQSTKRAVIGEYLGAEFKRANVTNREIAALFPSKTGGLTGCVSNWLLGHNVPTFEQYETMRQYLNTKGGDYLRREYDYLRREYEDLRREYEDLRRPFEVSDFDAYTDTWKFETVFWYDGKHPCEKPLDMMRHIVKVSSRAGDIVLDPFCGSGATLDAARQLGRRYIGGDSSPHWAAYARKRLALPYTVPMFE